MRELARDHNLIPLHQTFIDDCQTPVSAYLKLRDPTHPSFLLESAEQGRVGRYSFIGFRPRKVLRWSLGDDGDPYALAAAELRRFRAAPLPDLPPFAGGAVGMFAYDLVRTVEPLGEPNPDPVGVPDLALMLTDALVVFDHLKRTTTVVANVYADDDLEGSYRQAAETIAEVRWRLARPAAHADPVRRPHRPAVCLQHASRGLRGDGGAHHRVHLRRRRLPGGALPALVGPRAGGGVLDLSWPARRQPQPVHVLPGLRRLRDRRGQPRAADHGQRPAGVDAADRRHPARARARPRPTSPWPRTCWPTRRSGPSTSCSSTSGATTWGGCASTARSQVESFMAVENYSHVMHIVSSVVGTLRPGVDALAALRSVLPAGTLSGAPKVRAMQIIDELEPVKRGGYGGAIGWASYTGELDTCIHIRTVVVKDGVAHIQAGGGTVADAKPDYEFRESEAKSRAVLEAIALAVAQPEWP